jgi:hypothetical protein
MSVLAPFDEFLHNGTLYLLLHLSDPTLHEGGSRDFYSDAVDTMARATGFQIGYVSLDVKSQGSGRFVLSLPNAERDDFRALEAAQTIVYCHWATSGPLTRIDDPFFVLPIPPQCVKGGRIQWEALESFVIGAMGNKDRATFIHMQLLLAGNLSAARSAAAWRLASVAFGDRRLKRAIRHLVDSQTDFYAYPGEIPELLEHAEYSGYRWWEWSQLEQALISAYSAVEALIGDPPRNGSKLRRKLHLEHHINPDMVFRQLLHLEGLTVAQMVHHMQQARDTKAAHGSTPDGSLTLAELLEFQSLARSMIFAHAEHILGESL